MAKRGTPRSIEEYVAKTCAVALKTKRIRQLERENHLLYLKTRRYEEEFLHRLDNVNFCTGCGALFDDADLQECKVFECGKKVCYHCRDGNNCVDCGKIFCNTCYKHCDVKGCLSCICLDCVEKNEDCEHRLCQKHCNPCSKCNLK